MEIFEMTKDFIKPELIILIPVLYIIGMAFKKSTVFKDKFIPIALGLISIILTGLYLFAITKISNLKDIIMAIFISLTQGVLIAGASVYANQIYKQLKKNK